MRFSLRAVLLGVFLAPGAMASDLQLSATSNGQTAIKVGPGSAVPYTIFGELSDSQNEGLALFCFDLAFSGGPLGPANTPTIGAMANFAVPLGINNPAGFGGTVVGGVLRQVGGGQNTILNSFAPFPSGSVLTGIAQPGAPAALASGTLTAPYTVGTYILVPSNLTANAIRFGETGVPFWRVDEVQAGAIAGLTVEVEALSADVFSCSVAAMQSQTLSLDAGPAHAGRSYFILGSGEGTSPGYPLSNGLVIPLNSGPYFNYMRTHPNPPWLPNSLGFLDGQGRATAVFTPVKRFIGDNLNHAFVLLGPINFVSNPVPCQILP